MLLSQESSNLPLFDFSSDFFTKHLITYLGNKRELLPFLYQGIHYVQKKLGKQNLAIFDVFSGSGVVARLLKEIAHTLYVNDLEYYSFVLNSCYLANQSYIDLSAVQNAIEYLNKEKLSREQHGFIETHYAPQNDSNIQEGERVFYTRTNARIIDNIKSMIFTDIQEELRMFCLAPLLVKASIHTNTSGIFKGFHKKNGKGHFGGKGEHALKRILSDIHLDIPIFSRNEAEVHIYQEDANIIVKKDFLPEFDIAYLDPPYNQHPYGSNYFMLNIIASLQEMPIQSGISGITVDWNRSLYNKKGAVRNVLLELIHNIQAKYILLSYNNEAFLSYKELYTLLSECGKCEILEKTYATYKGSRNLRAREKRVVEYLYIVEK